MHCSEAMLLHRLCGTFWSASKVELLAGVRQQQKVGQQHALSYVPGASKARTVHAVDRSHGPSRSQLKSPGSGQCLVFPLRPVCISCCLLGSRTCWVRAPEFLPCRREHVLTCDVEESGGREDSLLFSLWISRKHPSLGCTSLSVAISMEPTILILNYCPV